MGGTVILEKIKYSLSLLFVVSAFQIGCTSSNDSPKSDTTKVVRCDGKGDVDSFGIVGGRTLSNTSKLGKGVVYIITSYYEHTTNKLLAEASCTGALIDSNMVLTAAHCFGTPEIEDINPSDIGFKVTVYTGFRPFCQMSQKDKGISADEVKVNEAFLEKERTGDIALVRLSEVVPGEHTFYPLDSNTHNFAEREKLVAVGYGKTQGFDGTESDDRPLKIGFLAPNNDSSFQSEILNYYAGLADKVYNKFVNEAVADERKKALRKGESFGYYEEQEFKRKLRKEIEDYIKAMTPKFDYSNSVENLVFDQSKGDGVCAGDSGGPGLRMEGDSLRIIGVAQAVFSYKSWVDQCKFGSIYTNVAFHKNWIIKTFNTLSTYKTAVHKRGEDLFQ